MYNVILHILQRLTVYVKAFKIKSIFHCSNEESFIAESCFVKLGHDDGRNVWTSYMIVETSIKQSDCVHIYYIICNFFQTWASLLLYGANFVSTLFHHCWWGCQGQYTAVHSAVQNMLVYVLIYVTEQHEQQNSEDCQIGRGCRPCPIWQSEEFF